MRDIIPILGVGLLVGFLILLGGISEYIADAQPVSKPFNVYQTDAACVYVAGYGSTASIAVMPRYYARPGPC